MADITAVIMSYFIDNFECCASVSGSSEIPPVNSFGKGTSAHIRGWYVPQSRSIMHNANDSLPLRCCNVKLSVSVKFQPYVKKYIYKKIRK